MSDPSQSALSSQIDSHQLSLLMKDSNELDRARLLCVSQPHATAFLSAIPISNMGLALSNEEWSVSVGLVIGAQLFDSPFPCNAGGYKGRCSMMMDVHGHHALRCKFSGDAKPRHNKIRDLLFKKLQDAYANPLLEPAHLLRDDGKNLVMSRSLISRALKPVRWMFSLQTLFNLNTFPNLPKLVHTHATIIQNP